MSEGAREELKLGPRGLYRTLWRYAGSDRPRLIAFMTMLITAQLMKLSIPYLSGAAVNAMQRPGSPDFAAGAWDMALIFIVCLASWGLHGPARVMERSIGVLAGVIRADAAPVNSAADALLASRLAAQAFSSGDVGQFDTLMAAGTRANLADNPGAAESAFRAAL